MTEAILLTGGIGPCEKAWEDFRTFVLDGCPHKDDDTETRMMFLCGMRAAVELLEAGVSGDRICAEIKRLVKT